MGVPGSKSRAPLLSRAWLYLLGQLTADWRNRAELAAAAAATTGCAASTATNLLREAVRIGLIEEEKVPGKAITVRIPKRKPGDPLPPTAAG